ncbi:MerR family transcriptional regulator [Apilactobacillus timberlakei]|uniref:MerR family transcriptional regulator n=1 Tax=Apilactobacillus timberlakei TaxID=2008380 RepID=A0ABY2YVV8_9LACO|nr:MerR family transcriptional regulator [Apilactobacillus timberlakei]TPR12376.1 MerR family transcriptional regulator [Apilactobacillus timberlakei]TPR12885.1 MerR family transcriptional regulator [Apilactobacillus timberlakei]TPR14435.1 MerR family transcriptional regulator [Apilactobacillus timberlakei]TPR19332.1 MerR family transcriptional regulator [Apilactobacillus timberlakei]
MEIKNVARIVGLNENTIRYYSDNGLIPNIKRDKNNHRIFDEEAINWLIGDKRMREAGMSINDLKEYVDLCLKGKSTIKKRYQIIQNLKSQAQTQLKEAQQRVDYLSKKSDIYEKGIINNSQDILNPKKW